ncbi:MAG: hypothetical protein EB059_04510 [Alphaproteobacteria bacterium]|nr:hypothetical protein [Alphaproteobacteria bacterium]
MGSGNSLPETAIQAGADYLLQLVDTLPSLADGIVVSFQLSSGLLTEIPGYTRKVLSIMGPRSEGLVRVLCAEGATELNLLCDNDYTPRAILEVFKSAKGRNNRLLAEYVDSCGSSVGRPAAPNVQPPPHAKYLRLRMN